MKKIKYLLLTLIGIFALSVSCSDDKELIPVWESSINGEGTIISTAQDFKSADESVVLEFGLKWISVDGKASVTKMEAFITFKENYVDDDGNPAVADHGTKPLVTFEGAAVPGNRTDATFTISQPDVYALFQGQTYDYKDGTDGNLIDIFSSDINPARSATVHFAPEDKFTVTWQFTGSDGRVFRAWSPSVCTEFPGSNCQVDFGIVCAEDIEKPDGDWTINMTDSYGDGWQGGFIGILVDGVEVATASIPNGGGSSGQTVYTYSGSGLLSFEWNKDTYDSECGFTITSPSGNVVANVVGPPTEGKVKLNLCKE